MAAFQGTSGTGAASGGYPMMDGMMYGPIMWGMGVLGLLVILVLVLAAAALIKYVFFK